MWHAKSSSSSLVVDMTCLLVIDWILYIGSDSLEKNDHINYIWQLKCGNRSWF